MRQRTLFFTTPTIAGIVFVLGACAMTGANGETPNGGPSGVFDDRERFAPPSELDVVDVEQESQLTLSREVLADELTTVSVTPDGQISMQQLSLDELQMFMESISETEDGESVGGSAGSDGATEIQGAGSAGVHEYEEFEAVPESVIGTDERRRINGTTAYPFRTVGRIAIGCTGTLIGPRHVLTAGHCVYNTRTDKWYSQLGFSPGQNGSNRPWGEIAWARAITVKGWTNSHKRNYDYAMIVLKKNIGNQLGWLGYGWKSSLPKYNVNINGYPGDKPSGTMWHSFCQIQIIQKFRLYYPCDTAGGMSGSAAYVYKTNPTSRITYGIHAYGVDGTGLNGATRIRKAVFENLKKWKATY